LGGNELVEICVGEHLAWALHAVTNGNIFERTGRNISNEGLDRAAELCSCLGRSQQSIGWALTLAATPALAKMGVPTSTLIFDPGGHVGAVPKKLDQQLFAGDAVHPSHEPGRIARDLRLAGIAREFCPEGIARELRLEGARFVGWCAKGRRGHGQLILGFVRCPGVSFNPARRGGYPLNSVVARVTLRPPPCSDGASPSVAAVVISI
jgi:hypothetical protein